VLIFIAMAFHCLITIKNFPLPQELLNSGSVATGKCRTKIGITRILNGTVFIIYGTILIVNHNWFWSPQGLQFLHFYMSSDCDIKYILFVCLPSSPETHLFSSKK
jgi:hypothetical protein